MKQNQKLKDGSTAEWRGNKNLKIEHQKLPNSNNRGKISQKQKNEWNLSNQWDYNKRFNICVIDSLKERKKRVGLEKYSKK